MALVFGGMFHPPKEETTSCIQSTSTSSGRVALLVYGIRETWYDAEKLVDVREAKLIAWITGRPTLEMRWTQTFAS